MVEQSQDDSDSQPETKDVTDELSMSPDRPTRRGAWSGRGM